MSSRPAAVRLAVLLVMAAAVAVALWLLPISPAALVPRTVTSWLIVGGIVLVIVLWNRLAVPRITRRAGLRTVLKAVPVLALLAVVLVPALIDREVSEDLLEGIPPAAQTSTEAGDGSAGTDTPADSPTGSDSPSADGGTPTEKPEETAAPAPAEPERLSSGEIRGVGHQATGQAIVYRSGDTTFVRLEGIDIQGAVDVFVWLVPEADQTEPGGGVNLGALKGTRGDANYIVPPDVDAGDYRTVLLWCRAFSTPIAVATQS